MQSAFNHLEAQANASLCARHEWHCKLISDSRVLGLVEKFPKAQIEDGLDRWTPESGAPQGAVLSPFLSKLYLKEFDHLMASAGYEMTRYADDLVIRVFRRISG
jgi:hypothetical protein